MVLAWHAALAMSLLMLGASAQATCSASGLAGRLAAAKDFSATSQGKCNSKDACYAMMQMDQLCAEGKFDTTWCNPAALGNMAYYSPYKVKQSMLDGGNAANSAACSFGTMAKLYKQGLISSNCAKDIADPSNPHRGAIINMFAKYWCPYVLTHADLLCGVTHDSRETKFAVIDCDNVPIHVPHLSWDNSTDIALPFVDSPSMGPNTQLFWLGVACVAGAGISWLMKVRGQAPQGYEPLLDA